MYSCSLRISPILGVRSGVSIFRCRQPKFRSGDTGVSTPRIDGEADGGTYEHPWKRSSELCRYP